VRKQTLDQNDGLKCLAKTHVIGEEGTAEAFDAVREPVGAEALIRPQVGAKGGWFLDFHFFPFYGFPD